MNRLNSPIRAYIKCSEKVAKEFYYYCGDTSWIVIDQYEHYREIMQKYESEIEVIYEECLAKDSKFSLLSMDKYKGRVEYGAIIRENVELADGSIVLMGAVINKDAKIENNTMIDMNAVIGSGAYIGANCHISAGVVIAGVMEPKSDINVIIEDNVFIGANSVIVEGVRIGKGSIVGAGSIVTKNVESDSVVYGNPAKLIRKKNEQDEEKVQLNEKLRSSTLKI